MKTIAITIDPDTLADLDRLAARSEGRANRSAVVREAIRDLASRERRRGEEERDAILVRKHKWRLAREAVVLVRVQARP